MKNTLKQQENHNYQSIYWDEEYYFLKGANPFNEAKLKDKIEILEILNQNSWHQIVYFTHFGLDFYTQLATQTEDQRLKSHFAQIGREFATGFQQLSSYFPMVKPKLSTLAPMAQSFTLFQGRNFADNYFVHQFLVRLGRALIGELHAHCLNTKLERTLRSILKKVDQLIKQDDKFNPGIPADLKFIRQFYFAFCQQITHWPMAIIEAMEKAIGVQYGANEVEAILQGPLMEVGLNRLNESQWILKELLKEDSDKVMDGPMPIDSKIIAQSYLNLRR